MAVQTLAYESEPGFGSVYKRILLKRRPGLKKGQQLPRYAGVWKGARVDHDRVLAYRDVCRLSGTDDTLPVLYPHVLTSGMQLDMMTQPDFPISMLGAVHLRNHVLQHRLIRVDEILDMRCEMAPERVVKQGLEWDVNTTIEASGRVVWEEISTYLVRGKYGEAQEPPARSRFEDLAGGQDQAAWNVPPGMGRRYAKITGDYNPIHVSKILAKAFGFKKDLIHGMWSLARCIEEFPALPQDQPILVDAAFKGPVYMGSNVQLIVGDAGRFDLFAKGNDRPVINGRMQTRPAGERLT
ncbi:MAG: MaoC family dehydratase [Candidatus Hydrogenedentes bacterium]|nr:MaoC family dehydratase [Candidatus Hydrogenedentota bacterium]